MKVLKAEGEGHLVTPIVADLEKESNSEVSAGVQHLMGAFDDIFQVPTGLPPRGNETMRLSLEKELKFPIYDPTGTLIIKRMRLKRL